MSDLHLDRRALLVAGAGAAGTATILTFEPASAAKGGAKKKKKQTKTFKGTFKPGAKDWYYLGVKVPRGVREIEVSYETPDAFSQFGTSFNVIDIGIFDPSGKGLGNEHGFRGWSGGARKSFRISRTSATPGYLAGPITPGTWKIALGPYQITKQARYRVKVTLHFGKKGAKFTPAIAPTATVPERGAGWYRGDLHVHTVHSDGSQTQADVIGYAKAAGLDFIGTSEHNTPSAMLTWGRYVPEDFLVICGEEVTTRTGHWLATGLPAGAWIDWRYRPEDGVLADFTEQVRDLGGLSIAAHPYQAGGGITWEFGYDFAEMDAVEVWNGPWTDDDNMTVARWHTLLSNGVFKPAVGNSDTHGRSQQIGLAQTVVRSEALTSEALINGYRYGRSWITGSSSVDLDFTAALDDVVGQCGDRVPSSEGQEVAVHLTASGVPAGSVATLLGPDKLTWGTATADASGALVLDADVPGGTAFVRAEVRSGAGAKDPMVALTNPIFLTAAG
jgi:hypothetical protein